jgi:hypothetical protein
MNPLSCPVRFGGLWDPGEKFIHSGKIGVSVVGCRLSVVGGRWSVVGGRWSVVGGRGRADPLRSAHLSPSAW